MKFELFRAVTPYLTLLLAVGIGILGWFLKWMVNENSRNFDTLKSDIEGLEKNIKDLEKTRQTDQRYLYEKYVTKEAFLMAVGKTEALLGRIFEQINELSRALNQTIGAINATGKKNHE